MSPVKMGILQQFNNSRGSQPHYYTCQTSPMRSSQCHDRVEIFCVISDFSVFARAATEQTFSEYILPLPSASSPSTSKNVDADEVAWTDRLLNIMQYLDEKAVKALLAMTGIKVM